MICCCCSVDKLCLFVAHALQHIRLLCLPLSPEVCSNSRPLNQWCYLTISSFFCHPLVLLPLTFPSIRVFSNESTLCIRWPKYWSFSISPSNIYTGLIFFRIDRFDLLAIQGTLKSLLQHHNSKASSLWHSAFFMVQLSHPHMTWLLEKYFALDVIKNSD